MSNIHRLHKIAERFKAELPAFQRTVNTQPSRNAATNTNTFAKDQSQVIPRQKEVPRDAPMFEQTVVNDEQPRTTGQGLYPVSKTASMNKIARAALKKIAEAGGVSGPYGGNTQLTDHLWHYGKTYGVPAARNVWNGVKSFVPGVQNNPPTTTQQQPQKPNAPQPNQVSDGSPADKLRKRLEDRRRMLQG